MCLKNTEIKLEFLTDIDMLLMKEKGIRVATACNRHATANNKYMRNYKKLKESPYFSIGTQTIFMDGQCIKNYFLIIQSRYAVV